MKILFFRYETLYLTDKLWNSGLHYLFTLLGSNRRVDTVHTASLQKKKLYYRKQGRAKTVIRGPRPERSHVGSLVPRTVFARLTGIMNRKK